MTGRPAWKDEARYWQGRARMMYELAVKHRDYPTSNNRWRAANYRHYQNRAAAYYMRARQWMGLRNAE